jgi:hypothetical protein
MKLTLYMKWRPNFAGRSAIWPSIVQLEIDKRPNACSNGAMRALHSEDLVADRHKVFIERLSSSVLSRVALAYESCIFFFIIASVLARLSECDLYAK